MQNNKVQLFLITLAIILLFASDHQAVVRGVAAIMVCYASERLIVGFLINRCLRELKNNSKILDNVTVYLSKWGERQRNKKLIHKLKKIYTSGDVVQVQTERQPNFIYRLRNCQNKLETLITSIHKVLPIRIVSFVGKQKNYNINQRFWMLRIRLGKIGKQIMVNGVISMGLKQIKIKYKILINLTKINSILNELSQIQLPVIHPKRVFSSIPKMRMQLIEIIEIWRNLTTSSIKQIQLAINKIDQQLNRYLGHKIQQRTNCKSQKIHQFTIYKSDTYDTSMKMVNQQKNVNSFHVIDFDKTRFRENLDGLLMRGAERRAKMEVDRINREKEMINNFKMEIKYKQGVFGCQDDCKQQDDNNDD